ncbi:MAG: hypothetical protein QHH13_06225 [Melioribacter sp.]|uniref:hypothetical protein n=1 Tax=Rosettibacter primus TaxID=3111523 RepID=UPI00247BA30A|nr:hypothetical protein [Melioribacter sp.]
MKKFLFIIFGLAILLSYSSVYAQNSDEKIIKETLTKLLNYSKEKSFEKAASIIAYTGEDKSREYKTSFDASNKEELNQVKRICKRISALLDISSNYETGKVTVSKENNIDIYTAEVTFISGEEKLKTNFKFVKIDKGFLLLSVN